MRVTYLLLLGLLAGPVQAGDLAIAIDDLPAAGKTLHLLVRSGPRPAAFAVAPGYNRTWFPVDLSKARVAGDCVRGSLSIDVQSDGWVPKEPLALLLEVDADGKAGTVRVQREGKALRASVALNSAPRSGRFTLDCRDALPTAGTKKFPQCYLAIGLDDGAARAVRIEHSKALTDTSFAAFAEQFEVRLKEGRLAGRIQGSVIPLGRPAIPVTYELDAMAIGGFAAGTVQMSAKDHEPKQVRVTGRFERVESARDAAIILTLHRIIAPATYMNIHATVRAGRITQAFAVTPNYNNAIHEVDASGLRLEGERLTGVAKVTINADSWIPADGKPQACEVTLDATHKLGEWLGNYRATIGTAKSGGPVLGLATPGPQGTPVSLWFKMEDALVGGNTWQNRLEFTCELEGDQICRGRIRNAHTPLAGPVESGRMELKEDRLRGQAKVIVATGGGAKEQPYVLRMDGIEVGGWIVGRFETLVQEKVVKTGQYWAAVKRKPPGPQDGLSP